MQDELDRIEVASIDALKKLKDEQDVLEGRIASMDELKGNVAEAVYIRVRADYASRLDALRAEAQPLKVEARTQYASLKSLIDRLESAHEAITLDRQEVELRHKLGEFDDKEFKKRVDDIEKQVKEKAGIRAQAQKLRERFLAAVASEADLESAVPAPAAANYSTSEMPAVSDAAIAASANPGATTVMPIPPSVAAPPPPDALGTMVMPAIRMPPPGAAAGTVVMQAVKSPPPASSDATVVFRPARLVPQNPEAGKTTFSLALKPMAIGSDPANDIRLGGAGIDARHAVIEPTAQGFVVRDLKTQHGTRVNAEKIAERLLANEDVVQIGVARFVFRAG